MKKLCIYYSLTGSGDIVASNLKDKGYDIEKIITNEPLPKSFFLRILIGGFKAGIEHKDKIRPLKSDIDKYEKIVIASPIWNGKLSRPIYSFLTKNYLDKKDLVFILYSGSGNTNKAKKQLDKFYSKYKLISLVEPCKNTNELKKIEKL